MSDTISFAFGDWTVLTVYIGLLAFLAYRATRRQGAVQDDFLLGGRLLSLPGFIAALVATWYGGILGVGEFTYLYGIANWFVFGFPYYIFALVFALFFARKVRESEVYSISDMLYETYDRKTGMFGSAIVFFVSSPAPYMLMLAILVQVFTGLDLLPALLISAVITIAYVYWGGFRALVSTDILQFGLMFLGFIVLLGFLFAEHGIVPFLTDNLPPLHFSLTGGNSWQYIVVWFFIALWTLISPPFHQFTLSAKDAPTARRGIFISIGFWMVFDTITTLSGLYARALLPGIEDPALAFPLLAETALPEIAKGIFYVGMLGTIMSTVDGFAFVSAITVGRDMIARWKDDLSEQFVDKHTKTGLIVTAVVSVVSVLLFPSIVNLWYVIGTLFIPPLLLPIVTSYYSKFRITAGLTFISMVMGFAVALIIFTIGQLNALEGTAQYPFGIEPMYPGLVVSIGIYIVGNLMKSRS
ncbi:MAG: hypothetical protein CL946_01455 [Ectothiorhodospiraceae bacterium]|nr:hypothetical protein [Ectothiorhodospiraceae bacterium]